MNGRWLSPARHELGASDRLNEAIGVVERFVPVEPSQAEARRRVLEFTARHPDALHRSCLEGHLTGSTWVVDHDGRRGLVLLHAKVGRWLQPGGHADGDANLAAVAHKEATEETGMSDLEVWSDPIDIDVHLFVNRRGTEPDHLHLDVRFLVRAPLGAVEQGNHESEALRWIEASDLDAEELALDESTQRLARHGFALAARLTP